MALGFLGVVRPGDFLSATVPVVSCSSGAGECFLSMELVLKSAVR